jgi:hypothetical protein
MRDAKAVRVLERIDRRANRHDKRTGLIRGVADTIVDGLVGFRRIGEDATPGEERETYGQLFTGMAIQEDDDVWVLPTSSSFLVLGRNSPDEEGAFLEGPIATLTNTPQVAIGAAAGTGSPAVFLRNQSNDDCGTLVLSTGTAPTTGILATITFAHEKRNADYAAIWSPGDPDAAERMASFYTDYIADRATTTVVLRCRAALAASTSYILFYWFPTPVLR